MKKAYKKELNSKPLLEEDDSVCSVLGRPKKIVGFSEVLIGIKDELRVTRPWHKSRKVVTIVGMAGIGKTAVAKELYEDVSGEYDCCAWVNIGPKYVYREVMLSLLAQINPGGHDKMLPKSSYSSYYFNEPVRIKTCALHSAFWHISTREAEKAKFLHILSSYGDGFGEGIKGQRRLSVGKNVLFGIKDVRNSIESVSTMHSLLCVGPPHMYPVPLFFGRLRLLRVVDALTVRFYCFPMEVSKLVHLRYLALNCDQEIPAGTMSKLRNLESLIVGRSLCIKKSVGIDPLLPVEIWDMKELKHLQVTGFDLPAPPCDESLLPNLLTLSNVSIRSCTERILERIPKLKKLGIQIEWEPHATTVGSCCFRFEMSHLHKVESLKCVVVNPNLGCQLNLGCLPAARPLFDCYRSFSSHIQKLSLTGLGFPWREMSQIGRMDNLKVLKLRCFAFRGLKWETGRDAFPMLNFLLIEDCDLVEWKVGHNSFRYLRRLIIKHCYKLWEFPGELFRVLLHSIEVVDCNSLLVASVMGLHKGKEEFFQLHISSSWNKKGPSVP
ncbi:Unknown protein [Striga hermonthica]|uniref:NB-ARC domain-containing protein n=1 Tax=Striga hermonthica TaxID=68872 RepID=A0A9N7NP56_STRHE|nr:Unknown protein [Striga hermonthica]